MTDIETRALVFKNEAGDYFLVPQEALEQGRVPAEHRAEVERLVAEGEADDGDDVQGHRFWLWRLLTFIPDLPAEEGPYPPGTRTDEAR